MLNVIWASDIEPVPHGPLENWGPWELAPTYNTLEHTEWAYEIDLMACRTAAQCLDWIAQVAAHTWADAATVAGLVHALDDVLHLQAALCPSGTARTLTRQQVRAYVQAAAAWAPRWSQDAPAGDSA